MTTTTNEIQEYIDTYRDFFLAAKESHEAEVNNDTTQLGKSYDRYDETFAACDLAELSLLDNHPKIKESDSFEELYAYRNHYLLAQETMQLVDNPETTTDEEWKYNGVDYNSAYIECEKLENKRKS